MPKNIMISSPSIETHLPVAANLIQDYCCVYAKQVTFVTEFQNEYQL